VSIEEGLKKLKEDMTKAIDGEHSP